MLLVHPEKASTEPHTGYSYKAKQQKSPKIAAFEAGPGRNALMTLDGQDWEGCSLHDKRFKISSKTVDVLPALPV